MAQDTKGWTRDDMAARNFNQPMATTAKICVAEGE